MIKERFLENLQDAIKDYQSKIATENGDWIIKGFVDVYKNIYTITLDTKVVSKVMEILLIPLLEEFALKHNLDLELASQQNFYPDFTFICKDSKNKFAVDLKTTMKDNQNRIKGMTLGAFTGYFRNRNSTKNINYAYDEYCGHYVLGVIYSQVHDTANAKQLYSLDDIESINSVIRDFVFFLQPKYCIASDRPGSGNTKNIGSTSNFDELINGKGKFAKLGENIFDNYWTNYLTKDMAKDIDLEKPPYNNLETYLKLKKQEAELINHKIE